MSNSPSTKKRGRPHEDTCVFCYLRHTTCHGCVSYKLLSSWTPCQLSTYRPVWKKFGSALFYPDGARLIKKNRFQDAKLFADRLRVATTATFAELGTSPPDHVEETLSKSVSSLKSKTKESKGQSTRSPRSSKERFEAVSTLSDSSDRAQASRSRKKGSSVAASQSERERQKYDRTRRTLSKRVKYEEDSDEEDHDESDSVNEEENGTCQRDEESDDGSAEEETSDIDVVTPTSPSKTKSPSKPQTDNDWSEKVGNRTARGRRLPIKKRQRETTTTVPASERRRESGQCREQQRRKWKRFVKLQKGASAVIPHSNRDGKKRGEQGHQ
eukprot:TRINITY_DN5506_c0_g1_i1.p1 TRINITY_DN5506_c0_g1~~TRINITY_DN5506_c0_g1_i1.p1  ORF type:complete len:327 (-),score=61.12 TRINITY_DN5506_c0_g1_i1:922-1902(-)